MKKILVIEDDEQVRTVLTMALSRSGYDVAATENGATGLARAREWLPDLVLCDINMPVMDGLAVLLATRSDPKLANCQFVLMTGDQKRNKLRKGMDLGADDYLPKPFAIDQLLTCVDARLRRANTYKRLEEGMLRRHSNLFQGTLPHELITPINGILGFAEILKEDLEKIPKDEAMHMLVNIEASARRLHRTLMNFLALMSLENEAEDPDKGPAPAPVGDRASHVIVQLANGIADSAGRAADMTVFADPIEPQIDEPTLKTVLQHLVENACTFSQAGTPIAVRFSLEDDRPTLRVEDHGRGMSREQIEQIGVFTQFDRKNFEQQGLGIGLALCRRLIERKGGTLRLESEPGRGTTAIAAFA